jgi:hypothetical protein
MRWLLYSDFPDEEIEVSEDLLRCLDTQFTRGEARVWVYQIWLMEEWQPKDNLEFTEFLIFCSTQLILKSLEYYLHSNQRWLSLGHGVTENFWDISFYPH